MARATPETLGDLESAHISSPEHLHTLIWSWGQAEGPRDGAWRPTQACPLASSHHVHRDPPGTTSHPHSATPSRCSWAQGGAQKEAGQVGRAAICQLPFSPVQGFSGNTEHIKVEASSSLQHFRGQKPLRWCGCAPGTLSPRDVSSGWSVHHEEQHCGQVHLSACIWEVCQTPVNAACMSVWGLWMFQGAVGVPRCMVQSQISLSMGLSADVDMGLMYQCR